MIDFARDHTGQVVLLIIVVWVIVMLIVSSRIGKVLRDRRERTTKPLDSDEARSVVDQDDRPAPGDRRWSDFFGSYIEIVHYSTDNQYWFTVLSGPHAGRTYKNQSRWSILPLSKPAPDYPRRKL